IGIARTRALRTGSLFFFIMAGLLAAFVVASFTVVRSTPADLHGRYLLGIYLCLIPLCWHFLPRTVAAVRARTRTAILVVCGLSVIHTHILAFGTDLRRYFG